MDESFGGFNDVLHSFILLRGKSNGNDDDDPNRILGKFKVWQIFVSVINFFSWYFRISTSNLWHDIGKCKYGFMSMSKPAMEISMASNT